MTSILKVQSHQPETHGVSQGSASTEVSSPVTSNPATKGLYIMKVEKRTSGVIAAGSKTNGHQSETPNVSQDVEVINAHSSNIITPSDKESTIVYPCFIGASYSNGIVGAAFAIFPSIEEISPIKTFHRNFDQPLVVGRQNMAGFFISELAAAFIAKKHGILIRFYTASVGTQDVAKKRCSANKKLTQIYRDEMNKGLIQHVAGWQYTGKRFDHPGVAYTQHLASQVIDPNFSLNMIDELNHKS
ncbi:MAG TPA: hypothetical protein VE870_09815 [Bacteroidales bacterium]|nr:hypothetical protein [Bacteroidales bacterium]